MNNLIYLFEFKRRIVVAENIFTLQCKLNIEMLNNHVAPGAGR